MANLSQNLIRRIRWMRSKGLSPKTIAVKMDVSPEDVQAALRPEAKFIVDRSSLDLAEHAKRLIKQGYPEHVVRANFGEDVV
jgi:orotate phosphoribosyltransferase-like protein